MKEKEFTWLWDPETNLYCCSNCDRDALSDTIEEQVLTPYCPWCGKKMKNGKD